MSRNVLYLIIAVLIVVAAVVGYQLYQDRQAKSGVQINIGGGGVFVETK